MVTMVLVSHWSAKAYLAMFGHIKPLPCESALAPLLQGRGGLQKGAHKALMSVLWTQFYLRSLRRWFAVTEFTFEDDAACEELLGALPQKADGVQVSYCTCIVFCRVLLIGLMRRAPST